MPKKSKKKTTRNSKKKSTNPDKALQSQLAQLNDSSEEKDIIGLFSAKYLNHTKCLKKLSESLEKEMALFTPHLTACVKQLLQHTSFNGKFSSEDHRFQLVKLYQILLSQHKKIDLTIFQTLKDHWNNLPYLFIRQARIYNEEEITLLEELFCAAGEIIERLFADHPENSKNYQCGLVFTTLQEAIYLGFARNNQLTQTFWMYFNQLKGLEKAHQKNLHPLYKLRLATALITVTVNTVHNATHQEKHDILAPYFSAVQWYRKLVTNFIENKQNKIDLARAREILAKIECSMKKNQNLSKDFMSAYTTFFTASLSGQTDGEHISAFLIEVLSLINQSEFQEKKIDTRALFTFLATEENNQKLAVIKYLNHAFTKLIIPIKTNQTFFIKIYQAWLDFLTSLKAEKARGDLIIEYRLICGIHDNLLRILNQCAASDKTLRGLLDSLQRLHTHIKPQKPGSADDNSNIKANNINTIFVTQYKEAARQIKENQPDSIINYFQLTQLHQSLSNYPAQTHPDISTKEMKNWNKLSQWLLPKEHILFELQLKSLDEMHASLINLVEKLLAHNTDDSPQYLLALHFLKQQEIIYSHFTTKGERYQIFWRYFKQIELALINAADHLSNTNKLFLGETYLSILEKIALKKENSFLVPYASAKYWFKNFLFSTNEASVHEKQLIAANKKYQQNDFFVATTGDLNKRFKEACKHLLNAILAEETISTNNAKKPINSPLYQVIEKITAILYESECQKAALDTTQLFEFLDAEEESETETSETETTEEASNTESTEKISVSSPEKSLLLRDLLDVFATLIIPINTNLDLFFKLYQDWIDFLVSLEAQNTRALLLVEYELMTKLYHKFCQTLGDCHPSGELITSVSQSIFKLNLHIGNDKPGEFSKAITIKEKLFNYLTKQLKAALNYIQKCRDKTPSIDTAQNNESSEDKIETNTAIATPNSESSAADNIPQLSLNIFNSEESSNDGIKPNPSFLNPANIDFSNKASSHNELSCIKNKINTNEPDDSVLFALD